MYMSIFYELIEATNQIPSDEGYSVQLPPTMPDSEE